MAFVEVVIEIILVMIPRADEVVTAVEVAKICVEVIILLIMVAVTVLAARVDEVVVAVVVL